MKNCDLRCHGYVRSPIPVVEPDAGESTHLIAPPQPEPDAVHAIDPVVDEREMAITREGAEETVLLYAMVSEGDLAGAYWLVRSLSSSDPPLALPDWLLAAAQASPWIAHGSDAFVPELLDLASTRQPTGTAGHLMALSQAGQQGWVLYLEGSTDLAILQAFAGSLGHPASGALELPFVHYVANQPTAARPGPGLVLARRLSSGARRLWRVPGSAGLDRDLTRR